MYKVLAPGPMVFTRPLFIQILVGKIRCLVFSWEKRYGVEFWCFFFIYCLFVFCCCCFVNTKCHISTSTFHMYIVLLATNSVRTNLMKTCRPFWFGLFYWSHPARMSSVLDNLMCLYITITCIYYIFNFILIKLIRLMSAK